MWAMAFRAGAVTIVTQPQAVAVMEGDRAAFATYATGAGTLSYQWKKGSANIPGATTSSLLINAVSAGDAGSYSVVISETGGGSLSSNTVTLAVRPRAPGDVNLNFGGSRLDHAINAMAVQADGKVIVGGAFTTIYGQARRGLARMNRDGTPDYTFGIGPSGVTADVITAIALQTDGKILVIGRNIVGNGTPLGEFARVNPDGSLDTAFHPPSGGYPINAIAVQDDGKIFIGGGYLPGLGDGHGRLMRLHPDGTLDTAFASDSSGTEGPVDTIVVQRDHKVVVGGSFTKIRGQTRRSLARLNTDGTLDATFLSGMAGPDKNVNKVALDAAEKVVVAGSFTTINGVGRTGIARLNTDGSLDASLVNLFDRVTTSNGPVYQNAGVTALLVRDNGQIIIGGNFLVVNGVAKERLVAINGDGSVDFSLPDVPGSVSTLAAWPDGHLWIGGNFLGTSVTRDDFLARVNPDGSPAAALAGTPFEMMGTIDSFAAQQDGKLLGVASFKMSDGQWHGGVARLSRAGLLDTTFGTGGVTEVPDYAGIRALRIQPDGRVLVAGSFSAIGGVPRNCIARLNTDGTVDTTFVSALPSSTSIVFDVALQDDGKMLITGFFTRPDRAGYQVIARLNANGSLDTTFNVSSSFYGTGRAVALQRNGQVLLGGYFYDDLPVDALRSLHLLRLNSDGSTDASFGADLGGLTGPILGLAVQSDGKILVAGENVLARLTGEGLRDDSFGSNGLAPANLNGSLQDTMSLAVQADGKILMGSSSYVTGVGSPSRLARFNSNGTLDTTFLGNGQTGPDNGVQTLILQGDAVFIGGSFINVNGMGRSFLAQLYSPTANGEITVEQPAGIGLTDGVTAVNLGTRSVGSTGAVKTFTVRNTGAVPLRLGAVTMDGNNGAEFTILPPGLSTDVAPGASTTFDVAFTPTSSGAKSAVLHIECNDADENTFDITLTGQAVWDATSDRRAQMVTPANGTTLPVTATTFTWTPGVGVSSYVLWLGSAPGASDLWVSYEGTSRSRTVELPAFDHPVYLTLWSFIDGVPQSTSYTYNTPHSTKARLVTPANGSTLAAGSLPLTWDAGAFVSQIALWVGTRVDGYDLYSGLESARTRTVAVPSNGGKVYVTLWSLIHGVWQPNRYVFVTRSPVKAELILPANGATLTGTRLNLSWSLGTGVSSYAVWVGSTPGGYDIAAANVGTVTSFWAPIPGDGGPVYVTLWSLINGAYQGVDYWFTCPVADETTRPAYIVNPANGTTLASNQPTFTWRAGGSTGSRVIWFGSTPVSHDLFVYSSPGPVPGTWDTSAFIDQTVTVALPGDGRRVYATVFSLVGSTWDALTYYFTCPTLPDAGAALITSPAIGSTLTGTTLPLTWNAANGASRYYLWAGTAPAGYNLYAGDEGTNRNKTLTALPRDGGPVYVTLYSLIRGALQPSTAWFTTADPATGSRKAKIISPQNGSVLTDAAQTFIWDAGSGVTDAALWIGSSPGAYDVLAAAVQPNSSRVVPLPTDGRKLYVTLYSKTGTAYQSNSYFYTAPKFTASKSAIVDPAPGSTLTSTTQAFRWSTGYNASAYTLWIGKSPGGHDIYVGAEGTALSRTVTTLPDDGGPIYVTLWTFLNGSWQGSEHIFTAALRP